MVRFKSVKIYVKSFFLLLFLMCGVVGCSAAPKVLSPKIELKLMTYNILADPNNIIPRAPLLLRMMEESNCDVMALQETTPEFIHQLLKCPWMKNYQCIRYKGRATAPRGLFFITRYPILRRFCKVLPGRQRRAVLAIQVEIKGKTFTFATTHMESPLADGPTRAKQLELIFSSIGAGADVVLMGDLNFGDGEQPETAKIPTNYRDAWLQLHPRQRGYTWNIEKSDMAKLGSFVGEKSRRLDRILYKSPNMKPISIKIIGDRTQKTSSGRSFPSDHFGLKAIFELQ